MNDTKYIGLDVHQATISAAVLDSTGHLVMESILETKAATILQFVQGLRGSVQVTLQRTGLLSPVYHGENGVQALKELARSYQAKFDGLLALM